MATSTITRRLITDDAAFGAAALAGGAVLAHGFANFYAITTRCDEATVRAVNTMKGRPLTQVGSITAPPSLIPDVWDFGSLPDGIRRRDVLQLLDRFFGLGPFGFRGPAAPGIPPHLTLLESGVNTTQVIAPGYACPSNDLLGRSVRATGDEMLYITSANRSRHLTGADDSPAHFLAAGLRADFADEPNLLLVEHPDEAAARERFPLHQPMSTSVLGFHHVVAVPGDPRPQLILERHGSLPADVIRAVLAELGFGLVLGPKATTRLRQRDYSRQP